MDMRTRFIAAANGQDVDRPPASAWIHFGSSHWSPATTADAHISFQREYGWDYLKVMNDYRFPTKGDIVEAVRPEDLEALGDSEVEYSNFDKQREVLGNIRTALPDVPLIDTVFSPFVTTIRTLGDNVTPMLQNDPALAHKVISNITDRLVDYIRSLDGLSDGIYLSVNGASACKEGWGISPQEFNDFIAPYDRRVLSAAKGLVRVIHVHGHDIDAELISEYPAEVMSWSHHFTSPSLRDVALQGSFVPMGGVDEIGALVSPPSRIAETVTKAREETGDKLIVGPGCTLHSDTPPSVLKAIAHSTRG